MRRRLRNLLRRFGRRTFWELNGKNGNGEAFGGFSLNDLRRLLADEPRNWGLWLIFRPMNPAFRPMNPGESFGRVGDLRSYGELPGDEPRFFSVDLGFWRFVVSFGR